MSEVRIYEVGLDAIIEELERLERGYDFRLITGFEGVLDRQFTDTQERVASPDHPHVPTWIPTGSLKGSGRSSSDFDGRVWSGVIRYGGPSTGPNDPVEYAVYEMKRGGIHDWFAGLAVIQQGYERELKQFYARRAF